MLKRREFLKLAGSVGLGLALDHPGAGHCLGVSNLNKRALLLGIDGFDPAVMRDLMQKGRLPGFSALAAKGTFLPLSTVNPAQSPVVWSCIATGNNPGKHGLFDFIARDPSNYLPELAILRPKGGGFRSGTPGFSPVLHGPNFWDLLAKAGIPIRVVKWPVSFPPNDETEKVLAGLGVPDISGGLGRHAFFTDDRSLLEKQSRGDVGLIRFENGIAEFTVKGPMVAGLTGRKPATISGKITRLGSGKGIEVSVQGQEFVLREKQWSPWVRLSFDVGLWNRVFGICRYYLTKDSRFVSIYQTPIQIDPKDPCYPISRPAGYATQIEQEIGSYYTQGIPEDTNGLNDGHLDTDGFLGMCDQIIGEQEAMFAREFNKSRQGLLAFVFSTTDRIQHVFWAANDKNHPSYNPSFAKSYGHIIVKWYQRMDALVQKVLPSINDDDLLIVCSDHGFSSFYKGVHLNHWLVEKGYMRLKKDYDPGDPEYGPLFKFVDWERTRAYGLGLNSLYVNLKGREGQGIVAKDDYQPLVSGLKEELEEMRDPENGREIVRTAYPGRELFSGPQVGNAPDLVLGFNRGYRMSWQTAVGATPDFLLEANHRKWTADHCVDAALVPGMLFVNRKNISPHPEVKDIAPTILKYFGVNASMDGSALI